MVIKIKTDDLKNVLKNLKEDPMRTILTEHFIEKVEERGIDESMVYMKLEHAIPRSVRRISEARDIFELSYYWMKNEKLIIVILLFPPESVVLITAFLRGENDEN